MNSYNEIINRIKLFGETSPLLQAAIIIGSQARINHAADKYSDLDIIFVVKDTSYFLYSDEWVDFIGKHYVSFIENTILGMKERRILFEDCLDVDFVILTEDIISNTDNDFGIFERGYRVLIDKVEITSFLPMVKQNNESYVFMSEMDFVNKVNDFWYHTVWTVKKIKRGELWTAKSCMDCYLKNIFLQILECHAHVINGVDYDTWHNGRFIEEWSNYFTVQKISSIFSRYDKDEMMASLIALMDLFRTASIEISKELNYIYPDEADRYTTLWVASACRN